MIERRVAGRVESSVSGRLTGYAAVFDKPSRDLGGFVEVVKSGAFAQSLLDAEQISALYDHDRLSLLGRVGSGTLKLAEDARGLRFDIELPDTSVGRDLAVLVERGDVAGASFAFRTIRDEWKRGEVPLRELHEVELHEITITANPAYPDTEVARRSLSRLIRPRLGLAMRFMETV